MTALIKLKIAVLTPMPKPRISTAVTVNPGDLMRSRAVYLRDPNKPRIVLGDSLGLKGKLHAKNENEHLPLIRLEENCRPKKHFVSN